ncbi:unnamed protein product, partial [Amoebophrya sp. A25]
LLHNTQLLLCLNQHAALEADPMGMALEAKRLIASTVGAGSSHSQEEGHVAFHGGKDGASQVEEFHKNKRQMNIILDAQLHHHLSQLTADDITHLAATRNTSSAKTNGKGWKLT